MGHRDDPRKRLDEGAGECGVLRLNAAELKHYLESLGWECSVTEDGGFLYAYCWKFEMLVKPEDIQAARMAAPLVWL